MEYIKRGATYREIGGPDGLLARGLPFDGNSMSARTDRHGAYCVYSYATEIARVDADGRQTFNDQHYSQTTSRQQNLCHAWLWGRIVGTDLEPDDPAILAER